MAARDGLITSPNLSLIPPESNTPQKGNDRRSSSVRLRFQFHHDTHDAVLDTRVPSRVHHGEMCAYIFKCIKNLSFKTDNWLIGATATGLEVKGMYTSQKYSSLVLMRLRFYTVSSLAKIAPKNSRKRQENNTQAHENATPTHTSNLCSPQSNVCSCVD